jgi:thymidylate synthase (FAD)
VNSVELIGYYGGDESHSLSAWTSTSRDLTPEKEARIPELLRYLAEHRHLSPFEKSTLHFLVTAETASHIHLLKHRIGVSINGESARYKELKDDKAYIPGDWPQLHQSILKLHVEECFDRYHKMLDDLTPLLGRKRAKESARFFLPYANQCVMDVSFNFRSFMHFQELRNAADAQLEIREIAESMLDLVRMTGEFEYSLKAFGY